MRVIAFANQVAQGSKSAGPITTCLLNKGPLELEQQAFRSDLLRPRNRLIGGGQITGLAGRPGPCQEPFRVARRELSRLLAGPGGFLPPAGVFQHQPKRLDDGDLLGQLIGGFLQQRDRCFVFTQVVAGNADFVMEVGISRIQSQRRPEGLGRFAPVPSQLLRFA